MPISTLGDLFVHLLKDIYYAEKRIAKSLPTLADHASSSELARLFNQHHEETLQHIERLEQAFDTLDEEAEGEKCPAIDGILDETNELVREIDEASTMDAALIAAAQAVEHYEITRYGTILTYADELGHDDVVDLLRETLNEEEEADAKLTRLAEDALNARAA